ncbi:ISL3-like element IS466 family transposase [Streptomyces javensis]
MCGRTVQTPGLTRRHARRTRRTQSLAALLTDVALFLGGRPGTRLSARMSISTCTDTLLRMIRTPPAPAPGLILVLGVDEFALRRRRTYATILIDITTHRPVDVLADRTAETFATWLRDHPEVRVICRDRARSFRDGAGDTPPAAPSAQRELDSHGRPRPLVLRTRERYHQIHKRIERGDSMRAIARELGLSRGSVALSHRGHPDAGPALPLLTVRRVTGWIMRRPEHLTDTERKLLTDLCERCPTLASTTEYARRLAALLRDRRNEHLAFEVWLADVRLDAPRELRTLGRGMRRDRAALLSALLVAVSERKPYKTDVSDKRACPSRNRETDFSPRTALSVL